MKTILITGVAGFIGSNLTEKLITENKIIGIDNFITGNLTNIHKFKHNPHFKLIHQDINKPIKLNESIDEIYNLACPASPVKYQQNPIHTIQTNTIGIYNILNLAIENQSNVIQSSTSEIYGNPKIHPQKETYNGYVNITGKRSCYDEGKRIAETICTEYHNKYQLNITPVRIFNTYGKNMDKNDGRVISNFINQAINNQPLTIYGTGEQTRSLMYITDLTTALTSVMENITLFNTPVNIGNPEEITINDLADKILTLTKSKSQKIYYPLPSDDPTKRKPNIDLIKSKINWKPQISLNKGLSKTIEYYKNIQS